LLSVVAQALRLLYQCVCRFLSLSSGDAIGGRLWVVQVLSAEELVTSVVCRRRFSPLRRGDYSYDVELYVFAKMLRFHKNVQFRLNSEISFEVSFGASLLVI
jgi:hypothetical protein